MSGLFRRLSSRRSAGPEGDEPQTAAQPGAADAPAKTPAEAGGRQSLLTDPAAEPSAERPPDEQPTVVLPGAAEPNETPAAGEPVRRAEAPAATPPEPSPAATPYIAAPAAAVPAAPAPLPVADLPAGLDPDALHAVPATSAGRGRLRRRIAFLRAAREVLLRDLGGFVYELHRTAHDIEHEAHRRLRETKLERLTRVDTELHELEYRLDDVRRQVVVREPGVGGECPECDELFGSAARYCSNCGLALTESARRAQARPREPEPLPDPVVAPPPEAAAPVTDQPTQEIPPLDLDHPGAGAEFEWPRREGASWTSEPTGGTAAAGEAETNVRAASPSEAGDTGEEPDSRLHDAIAGEAAHTGDEPTREPNTTLHEATPGEAAEAPDADGPAQAEPVPSEAAQDEPVPSDAAHADAAADDEPVPSDAAHADAPAPVAREAETTPSEAAGADAPPSDADAPANDAPTGDAKAPRADESPNGSVLRPVDRRP